MISHRPTLSTVLGLRPTQAALAWILAILLSLGVATIAAATDKADRTLLNQKSLSVVVGEIRQLLGPREQPIALNRILGVDQSLAMTRVRHNNRLVLVNPHRVLFDQLGFVDTGEFLATTLRVRGNYEAEAVVSSNTVHVSEHGYIALGAPGVTAEAVVIAAVSTAPSDAEQKIVLDFMSDGLVRYAIGESELSQFTGVDGKALAKASSEKKRHEAVTGQMLVNVRSAAEIQRSVMNTENVPRARHLVVENGTVRLEGESPLHAMRTANFYDNQANEPVHQGIQKELFPANTTIAMVNPVSSSLKDAAQGSYNKRNRADGALSSKQSQEQRLAVSKKATAKDSSIKKARRGEGNSGAKGKTKAQKTSPLPRANQPKSTPWSSMPGGLPEWMKYLPRPESSTEHPTIP